MGEKRIYRGLLVMTGNGEDDELLGLMETPQKSAVILAEDLNDDLYSYGRYVSVRYFVTDTLVPAAEMDELLVRRLYGEADFDYGMHYSEITGYLWTDEDLKVGGHDLLEELKSSLGKWLHLEIEYHKHQITPPSGE